MTKNVILPAVFLVLLAAVPLHADDAVNNAVKAVDELGGKVTLDNKDAAHPIVGVDLAAQQRLQALNLGSSSVTSVGVVELERSLPDFLILH